MKFGKFNNKLVTEKLRLMRTLPNNEVLLKEVRDRIILDCIPLVHKVVITKYKKFPDSPEFDDLTSVGMIGLIDAINKYDPENDASFKTYAWFRIVGSICDDLRYHDDVSRMTRHDNRRISRTRDKLENRLGRTPTNGEVAEAMDLDLEEFQTLERKSQVGGTISFEDPDPRSVDDLMTAIIDKSEYANPEDNCDSQLVGEILRAAVKELRPNENRVIQWYYFDRMTIEQIAPRLDLTQARVSQIKIKAEKNLRGMLRDLAF